jgi:hypothetical protein
MTGPSAGVEPSRPADLCVQHLLRLGGAPCLTRRFGEGELKVLSALRPTSMLRDPPAASRREGLLRPSSRCPWASFGWTSTRDRQSGTSASSPRIASWSPACANFTKRFSAGDSGCGRKPNDTGLDTTDTRRRGTEDLRLPCGLLRDTLGDGRVTVLLGERFIAGEALGSRQSADNVLANFALSARASGTPSFGTPTRRRRLSSPRRRARRAQNVATPGRFVALRGEKHRRHDRRTSRSVRGREDRLAGPRTAATAGCIRDGECAAAREGRAGRPSRARVGRRGDPTPGRRVRRARPRRGHRRVHPVGRRDRIEPR